jgi:hypothetical protein
MHYAYPRRPLGWTLGAKLRLFDARRSAEGYDRSMLGLTKARRASLR